LRRVTTYADLYTVGSGYRQIPKSQVYLPIDGYKLISCACESNHPGSILFGSITVQTILNNNIDIYLPYTCYVAGDSFIALFYFLYYTATKVLN
jgi:hypothetical protein